MERNKINNNTQENDPSYADFSNSKIGRFGPHYQPHKYESLRPPSNVLYLAGVNGDMTNEELLSAYECDNATHAEMFKFNKHEAKVEFPSIGEAFQALIRTHGSTSLGELENHQGLRVAFSDRPLSETPIQVCFSLKKILVIETHVLHEIFNKPNTENSRKAQRQ